MCRFVESIRVEHRHLMNTKWHEQRMGQTMRQYFGVTTDVKLEQVVTLPQDLDEKTYKCRIEYGISIGRITIEPYVPREVRTLRLVADDDIAYSFKAVDRSLFDRLMSCKDGADDILIIKNGCVTDTSFSNVVLLRDGIWYTPDTYLLNGTCRQRLLSEGIIRETRIEPDSLELYAEIRLINAMLDWEKRPSVSILFDHLTDNQ